MRYVVENGDLLLVSRSESVTLGDVLENGESIQVPVSDAATLRFVRVPEGPVLGVRVTLLLLLVMVLPAALILASARDLASANPSSNAMLTTKLGWWAAGVLVIVLAFTFYANAEMAQHRVALRNASLEASEGRIPEYTP